MGNSSGSHLKLEEVMVELDHLESVATHKINRRVEKTPNSHVPYKIVIPIGETGDDIIKNLKVPDSGYRSVILAVGTQIFDGEFHQTTKTWHFPTAIPLFKIPEESCQLIIYSLGDCAQPIELTYDSYEDVPLNIKTRCTEHALISGDIMYNKGTAC